MPYTQANRRIAISTPLGEEVLLLRAFSGSEAISQLFHFSLDLLSESDSLSFEDIVGKPVSLTIQDADGADRYWHGFISRFSQGNQDGRLTAYHATMVPWLWFLTRTSDCRIFQNKKVPDIIQKVFKDLNFSDFELHLYGDFAPRDYCVQYRETDFNFVSRLMEEEGIYYFFKQTDDKHLLILANDPAAHEAVSKQATARLASSDAASYEDDITDWHYQEEFRTGTWTQTDYNFETPSTDLKVAVNGKNSYEIYDFPGQYTARGDGNRLAKIRLQEQTAPAAVSTGASVCRHFNSGFKFTLQDHYRANLNQAYLLTSVRHTATQGGGYSGGSTGEETTYANNFECIPFSTPFRPQRLTPEPIVQGCQTAVVVGPAGEEIYTDKYGRVKVQFHWDREGKKNENSSCWVRVSHPWAGKGWGSISIPRIGQEVIIDFLEGNPDQPIIIGRVYNAEQTPPFGMPGGAMISGTISNSTKGGGGNNEISLNDTKGNELINIHAQFDQQKKIEHDERVNVGNDRTESVGHDESITIGNNRTEKVGVNENIKIGSNRTESVGSNESITIGLNRTEKVGVNETITIGSARTESVGATESVTVALTRTHSVGVNDMLNVGAANEVSVGGLQAITVGLARAVTVGASQAITVGASQVINVGAGQTTNVGANNSLAVAANNSTKVGGDESRNVSGKQSVSVGSDLSTKIGGKEAREVSGDRSSKMSGKDTLDVGSSLKITAGSDITLETGQSKIVMKSSGDIEISGMSIKITGSTSIKEEAVSINIEASGVNTIKGSLVKIN
jgi:type VI secretion system secreted protein VgrG